MAVLGSLVEQIRGVSYKPEDLHSDLNADSIMLLRANNIRDDMVNFDEVVYVDRKKVTDKQLLKAGDILICTSSGSKDLVGKAAYIAEDIEATFGAFCKVVRPRSQCAKYIGHFFCSPIYRERIANVAGGANINNIRNEHIDELTIPLPALAEQESISALLDSVTTLISLRKQQIAKLDELVKARFVEMFGDPILNDKEFPMLKGEDFFKLSNGKAVPEDKRFTEGIPAFGGNGISWYTDTVMHTEDTLVVGRVGFQSGNVHLAKGPLWVTDNAMYMSACRFDLYNLVFLCVLMEHIDFTRYQDAGDLKKVTQKPFMQMSYIQPPMKLQEQFAAFVAQTDQQKLTIQHSLAKLELLKKALMQKYFG